jgi:hypothetical protein
MSFVFLPDREINLRSRARRHAVMLLPAELAVDADRNGTIVLANLNPSGKDGNGNRLPQPPRHHRLPRAMSSLTSGQTWFQAK